ncbi:MAG: LPXTG cell wall anchor domain-containing protein, partial [Ilumatobacteraceae bacterium]
TTVPETTTTTVPETTTTTVPETTTTPPTTLPATPAEDTTTTTPQTLPATGNHTFPSPTTWAALLLLSAGLLLGKSTRRRI